MRRPQASRRRVKYRPSLHAAQGAGALADLQAEAVVTGGSIWSLFRLLGRPDAGGDGFSADLFDLVCIDEASQMVLGHGLMALAGLKASGRVVVAGDDHQLPPIRAGREVMLGKRQLGGSLYAFLKSGEVPEFPLEETFRLNGPLAAFPERKFYPGHYRSAVEGKRLEMASEWKTGLEPCGGRCTGSRLADRRSSARGTGGRHQQRIRSRYRREARRTPRRADERRKNREQVHDRFMD